MQKDGRKWKAIARERMALTEWLGTHGDADGSRIHPGVVSMIRHFGWSRRKIFYLLANLRELGLLSSEGLTSEHGTRKRRINLAAFHGAGVQDSPRAGVQDSRAGVQSSVAHNRHLTDRIEGKAESNLRFPLDPPKPMTAFAPRTIEGKKRAAKTILVEKGHDADLVEIALLRVANLAAAKKKIPRTVGYFVASVENSLGDQEETDLCRSIAAERTRAGVPIDTPLRPDEWHVASKITFVRELVEEAARVGRPAREIETERLAIAGVSPK